MFKDLGVGVMQIAYNTQNLVGCGCYEKNDSGLSEFGHEVIAEMNMEPGGVRCDQRVTSRADFPDATLRNSEITWVSSRNLMRPTRSRQ